MTPTTKAGRALLEALQAQDALMLPGMPPVDWAHGLVAIEQEARADEAEALRAERDQLREDLNALLCKRPGAAYLAGVPPRCRGEGGAKRLHRPAGMVVVESAG